MIEKYKHSLPIPDNSVIFSMEIGLFFRVIKIAAPSPWKIYDGFAGTKRERYVGIL